MKHHVTIILCIALMLGKGLTSIAQETSVKLASDTDTSRFAVRNLSTDSLFSVSGDGTIRFGAGLYWSGLTGLLGLGTAAPAASLHLSASGTADGNVLFTGVYSSGAGIPATGAGTRMMWYPKKASLRAGRVTSSLWDDANIGNYSTALGYNSKASGNYSTAMGSNTTASEDNSTAMGGNTTASGLYSTALGYQSTADGNYSTSMGRSTNARGDYSAALGYQSTASGIYSTAMGYNTTASGSYSTTMGEYTVASGTRSTAMGSFVNTNGMTGSFCIGDASATYTFSTAVNQMIMRFMNGYRLYTRSDTITGVYMDNGAGSWSSISDRNRKENFTPVDGESLLSKIRHIPITRWNYKGADPSVQFIGPMAQDFWQAFTLGGTDSLGISTLAMDGVNLAAVKALEDRTAKMQQEIAQLRTEKESLRSELEIAQQRNTATENSLEALRNEVRAIKALLANNDATDTGTQAALQSR